jgi:hypothetical protein
VKCHKKLFWVPAEVEKVLQDWDQGEVRKCQGRRFKEAFTFMQCEFGAGAGTGSHPNDSLTSSLDCILAGTDHFHLP